MIQRIVNAILWGIISVAALFIFGCGCPEAEKIDTTISIKSNGWVKKQVTSKETGETYQYLDLPSIQENAPILVLIHGFTLNAMMFINCYDLAEQFHVISWQIPNESPLIQGSLRNYSTALMDFLDTLKISTFLIGGVSLGGMISWELFKYKPESYEIQGLLMISTYILDTTKHLIRNRHFQFNFLDSRSDSFLYCTIKRSALKQKNKNAKLYDPQYDIFSIFTMKPLSFYRNVIHAIKTFDGNHGADQITCPTLVIHGTEDDTVSLKTAKITERVIPNTSMITFEGCGHDLAFSHGEAVAKAINEWWAGNRDTQASGVK